MTFDQPQGGHRLIGGGPSVEVALGHRSIPAQWASAGVSTDGANFGAACWTAASFRLVRGRSVVSNPRLVGLTVLARASPRQELIYKDARTRTSTKEDAREIGLNWILRIVTVQTPSSSLSVAWIPE
jgi:hypothetical protein